MNIGLGFPQKFLIRLRELHESSGLSLREIAARSDLDYSYVSLILNGQRNPNRDVLISLGVSWGLTLSEIDELLLLAGDPPLGRSARREFRTKVLGDADEILATTAV